ncbi:hypothetical protein [uncultured Friedmanniella sp.]|uniref:hypothetical protein n=1 Tax=uncultured Friedmanniella sp. TaxID=335381 RepID=UPI0035CC8019
MRRPGLGRLAAALLVLVLAGCSAPAAAPTVTPPAVGSAAVRLPGDGVLLRDFGYQFGPLDSFSLPRTSVVSAAVDQADNVTLVLSAPAPADVVGYLRRALPDAGFTITAGGSAASGTTLTFTGNGWAGSVTGSTTETGVLLRPR